MSEEKKRSLTSYPSMDPRLLSIGNLCSMYEVFSKEQSLLVSDDPDGLACIEQLQSYMDVIIESLRIRLAENRQAEIDLGYGTIPEYGKKESE